MLKSVKIGVISDTHGLLRASARAALCGVEHIIHAGDVGSAEVLSALRSLAPVTAVRGNVDKGSWAEQLPDTAILELNGLTYYVLHDLLRLDLDPAAAGFAAVIAGHSHQPLNETRNKVLIFNPGSAGPGRFRNPVSLGILSAGEQTVSGSILILENRPGDLSAPGMQMIKGHSRERH